MSCVSWSSHRLQGLHDRVKRTWQSQCTKGAVQKQLMFSSAGDIRRSFIGWNGVHQDVNHIDVQSLPSRPGWAQPTGKSLPPPHSPHQCTFQAWIFHLIQCPGWNRTRWPVQVPLPGWMAAELSINSGRHEDTADMAETWLRLVSNVVSLPQPQRDAAFTGSLSFAGVGKGLKLLRSHES